MCECVCERAKSPRHRLHLHYSNTLSLSLSFSQSLSFHPRPLPSQNGETASKKYPDIYQGNDQAAKNATLLQDFLAKLLDMSGLPILGDTWAPSGINFDSRAKCFPRRLNEMRTSRKADIGTPSMEYYIGVRLS